MVIGIIGENCTGKSTLADKLKELLGAEVMTGKDYLRMAKSESEATAYFKDKLKKAVNGGCVIYVISENEHIALLPDGAKKILVTAELDAIKERFRQRMHGNLPAPVEQMLERKHGCFDSVECDAHYDSSHDDLDRFCSDFYEKMK